MKYSLITFRSVTPAQKGERALRRAGYSCNIQRTPRRMEEQGCGYSIRIQYTDIVTCVKILRENNINFRKVYLMRGNEVIEELTL